MQATRMPSKTKTWRCRCHPIPLRSVTKVPIPLPPPRQKDKRRSRVEAVDVLGLDFTNVLCKNFQVTGHKVIKSESGSMAYAKIDSSSTGQTDKVGTKRRHHACPSISDIVRLPPLRARMRYGACNNNSKDRAPTLRRFAPAPPR